MFAERPVLGVGWSDFGEHYLAHRVPNSAEEVSEPHNALVRFFTELGVVGGLLAAGWLARLAWEVVRPATPPVVTGDAKATVWVVGPPLLALGLVVAFGIDWAGNVDYAVNESVERVAQAGLMMIGLALASIRSAGGEQDGRAATVLAAGLAVAAGGLLLQSMVDFMLFETPVLVVFALIVGALVGLRSPSVAGRKLRTPAALAGGGVLLAGVAAWAVALVLPTLIAEGHADAGDALLREGRFAAAEARYAQAVAASPVSSFDLASRRALAWQYAAGEPSRLDERQITTGRGLLAGVQAARPRHAGTLLRRARFERSLPTSAQSQERALRHYAEAVTVDPNRIPARLEYADLLRGYGMEAEASEQYAAALAVNDAYDAAEPERLTDAQIAEIRRKMNGT